MKSLFKRLRLLPFVIAIGTGLLVVKGSGLIIAARAQDAGVAAPATAAAAPTSSSDPAGDDTETASTGEVDVLTSLSKRRAELDAREQDLTTQQNLIAAAEKRVDDKIAALKTLQSQMQTLLGQRDTAQQTQIASLVKTYSSMKPKDAARIFNDLDDDVLLSVAQQMKPDVLGAILAGMQAENAQKLTVRLANRLKPPAPAPAQLAALTPPATTSAPATTPAVQPQTTPAPNAPTPNAPAENTAPQAPANPATQPPPPAAAK